MAQTWETPEIQAQGNEWANQKKIYDRFSQQNGVLSQKMAAAAKTKMENASAEANRLRTALGYSTDSSGLNQKALDGYVADSTNTKFTKQDTTTLQQTIQAPTYKAVTDNSGLINSQYDNLISSLKSKIQQSINNKNTEISGLGAKYQPQKNASEVEKYSNLRAVLEQNANAGDRGGVGRQNALETQTAAANRLNTIGLQQTADETSLKNDIANLLLEGNVQEATFQASRLKDLVTNNQYIDEGTFHRQNQAFQDSLNALNTNTNVSSIKLRDALAVNQDNRDSAQAAATLKATQLANEAQAIANQYAPQIALGQINEQTLKNKYQELVNAGYPKQQAAELAATYANIRQSDASAAASTKNAQTNADQLTYQQQQDSLTNSNNLVKQYTAQIENQFATPTYDANSGKQTGTQYNYNSIKNYIKTLETSKAITTDQAKQLLSMYGFSY